MSKTEKYHGYRGEGVRLNEPLAPEMEGALGTLRFAAPLHDGLHMFDKAHLVALAETGIVPREDAAGCLRALLEMEEQGLERVREEMKAGIHSGEVYLVRKLGLDMGGRIHAGRSSGDLGWVSTRIRMRQDLLATMDALVTYRQGLLDLARAHTETVMPYYTHGQHAMPTTLALYAHAYACSAERDFARLQLAHSHTNVSVAGAAAGNASRFRLDRERTAELMGFDSVSANTSDASSPDHLWEMAGALAIVMGSLGSLADWLVAWSGQEHRLVQIADRYCHTSSIFAHKRNPEGIEYVQRVRALVTGRIPTSYTISELANASEQVLRALKVTAGVVATLKVNRQRMLELVSSFWAQIPDLAAVVVMERGLPWRVAHQIAGTLVRLAEEEGKGPADITPEMLDRAADVYMGRPVNLGAEAIGRAMDPVDAVRNRVMTGSAGPKEMERQIGLSKDRLDEDRLRVMERRSKLEEAERGLAQAVRALVSS